VQSDCSSQHFRENRSVALVDEAHRTQYKVDAVAIRKARPNAVFFAFTGTPIDKKNRVPTRFLGLYLINILLKNQRRWRSIKDSL
jgi:type I site-specific restriction-modification system R (restriction) subunit